MGEEERGVGVLPDVVAVGAAQGDGGVHGLPLGVEGRAVLGLVGGVDAGYAAHEVLSLIIL